MKAVIYCRVSTASQEAGTSLESQEAACRKYAREKKYEVSRVVSEVGSGASIADRRLLSDLRDALRRGRYQVVVAYAVDRLSRNIGHLMILLDEAERYNYKVEFVTETLDSSPEGKLLQSVKGYVAEVEREKIRERTMRGRRTHASNGTLSFRRKLFGYREGDTRREIIGDEAVHVARMFTLVNSGRSLRSIASEFNNHGVPTPSGIGAWWSHSIKSIINNPAYCGRTTVFRTRHDIKYVEGVRKDNGSAKTDPQHHIVLPDVTPPIVTVEEWEAAQAALRSNTRTRGRTGAKEFLLRGFVKCDRCGRQMSPVGKRKWRYYVCTSTQNPSIRCGIKSFPAGRWEEKIWSDACDLIRGWDPPKPKKIHDPLPALDRQIERLVAEQARIVKRSGSVDDSTWSLFEAELISKKNELDRLQAQKQVIMNQRSRTHTVPVGDIRKRYSKTLDSLPFAGRVEVLKALGTELIWDGETIHNARW